MTRVIGIGHNKAPLKELLSDAHWSLKDEIDDLLDDAVTINTDITNDEASAKASDFVVSARRLAKSAEDCRIEEKEPFLNAGREVDAFFKEMVAPLSEAQLKINGRVTSYINAKVAAEKKRQAEAEKIAREESARKLAEAEAASNSGDADKALDAAVRLESYANEAASVVHARPAELARTTSASGVTTTLKTTWAFEIIEAGKIPLEALRAYLPQEALEKAITAAVKYGVREMPGVRIYEKSEAVMTKRK